MLLIFLLALFFFNIHLLNAYLVSSQVCFRDLSGVLLYKDLVQLGCLTRTGMEPQNHLSSLKYKAETSAARTELP